MRPLVAPGPDRGSDRRALLLLAAVLAAGAYIPLLLTHPGMVGADTKAYLYLDPSRLLASAVSLWDPHTGLGTVTHENIGYLLPMGPWYWVFHAVGVPMWVAQRLWTGTLLFTAGLGVVVLVRTLGWSGPGVGVAAVFYELSPYVVQYEARISAILMPWSALPWMLALTIRAVRRGGWRDPALFALVTTVVGGVNASSLILVGLAPVLWLPFAIWGLREADWRRAAGAALRIALLTAVTALWWIAGLSLESGYGLNVLRYTETVQTVATSGTAIELLRGLGNWYFYGLDAVAAWVQPAIDYTQWGWLLAVSVAVPLVGFASAVLVRWREKLYFVGLILIGVALGVGVHPYTHPSPLGAVLKQASGSTAGLALRSTGRAVPLVVLGLAVMTGAGAAAVWQRRPRLGVVLAIGLAVLAVADMTPLYIGQFVDDQLQRPEAIPSYWKAVATYLDSRGKGPHGYTTRVLEEPGADFLHYRWGATLDPVTAGITDRPYVDRELVPQGSAASADLLRAFDERLQEGVLEPDAIAALARRMSIGDLVLRSDIQWERFRTPRPQETWALFDPPPPGLQKPVPFGPPVGDFPTVIPFEDEQALALSPTAKKPPAVAVFGVDNPEPIVRTEPVAQPIILAGDGEGMVDASAAGLLAGDNPVLYAGTLDASSGGYQPALAAGADLVLTDTNRRRAQRYGTIRDTFGYTQEAGEQALVPDPFDAPLPVFPGVGDNAYTVAEESGGGVAVVRASGYGNNVTYDPGSRPDLAVDGNPGTAWEVGAFTDVDGQFLQVNLSKPVTTGTITLTQPYTPHIPAPPGEKTPPGPVTVAGQRWITRVRLSFGDGRPDVVVNLGAQSRSANGQRVTFPARTFGSLRITIEATNIARTRTVGTNGVGFSEVQIGGNPSAAPVVDEILRLPTDLLDAAGLSSLAHRLTIRLTREQTNPAEPFTGNPEPAIVRTFSLPTARTFSLGGVAQISALAPDYKLDPLLGVPNPKGSLIADSSSRLPGDLAARASSAVDGNPATAWSPARGPQVGQWVRVDLPHPVSLSHLNLEVVADGHHSVPTELTVQVDGGASYPVKLPPIADKPAAGAVTTVPISLPGVTATHDVVFTIAGVRKVTTLDNLSNTQVTLPVGIAELGLPGIKEAPPAPSVPTYCRTDLLMVDHKPVPVHLSGSTATAAKRQDLTFTLCGPPLHLSAGTHTVEATPGSQTAIDLDRIVLSSDAGGGPDPSLGVADSTAAAPGSPQAPAVTVLGQGSTWAKVRVAAGSGAPTWLVLGESDNAGWTAHTDGPGGRSLGRPTLIDGYANGWKLVPPAGRSVDVTISWTPQRRVDIALVISALVGRVHRPRLRTALVGRSAPAPWTSVGAGSAGWVARPAARWRLGPLGRRLSAVEPGSVGAGSAGPTPPGNPLVRRRRRAALGGGVLRACSHGALAGPAPSPPGGVRVGHPRCRPAVRGADLAGRGGGHRRRGRAQLPPAPGSGRAGRRRRRGAGRRRRRRGLRPGPPPLSAGAGVAAAFRGRRPPGVDRSRPPRR